MNTLTIVLIIGFFVVSTIMLVVYTIIKKKSDNSKRREANIRNKNLYNDPNMGRVVLWIDLELVNNQPLDESAIYYSRVKSKMTGLTENVEVVLFKPGQYSFLVHSREYSNITLNVSIEAGKVYQIGADDDGPFFVLDPSPERYQLTEY